jgi:hypothetical protein
MWMMSNKSRQRMSGKHINFKLAHQVPLIGALVRSAPAPA